MDKKDIEALGGFINLIEDKVKATFDEHKKVETVLVDLLDELKGCIAEMRGMCDKGLADLTTMQMDPKTPATDAFRLLGKIEGWHDGSVLIVNVTQRVLERIDGEKQ